MYNLFDLQRQGVAYLCGHLHTLGGLFPRMYARPTQGHLELEAGDWKENRRYPVNVDLLSFYLSTSYIVI